MKGKVKNWLSFIFRPLMNQRGEVGDAEGNQDDLNVPVDDDDDIVITTDDEKNKDKPKLDAAAIKELQGKVSDFEKETKTLQDTINQVKEDKKNLNTALHQARQEKKTKKPDEPVVTEEELKKILDENPDDVDVQFKVLKQLAQQVARGVSAKSVDAADVSRKKADLGTFIAERYPDIKDPGSDIFKEVQETIDYLGLEDHPYGEYFAIAANVLDALPELLKGAFEEGKSGKTKKDTEDARIAAIKKGKLPASKKSNVPVNEGLTADQSETFNQMGLTKDQIKIGQKLVGKKPKTVSVGEY